MDRFGDCGDSETEKRAKMEIQNILEEKGQLSADLSIMEKPFSGLFRDL